MSDRDERIWEGCRQVGVFLLCVAAFGIVLLGFIVS
jgi:hypothetical protein